MTYVRILRHSGWYHIFNDGYLIGRGTWSCYGTRISTGVLVFFLTLKFPVYNERTDSSTLSSFWWKNSLLAVTSTMICVTFTFWFQRTALGKKIPTWTGFMERVHSCVQEPCKFFGTKESVYIRKELNSHRIGLVCQHGRRFTNMAVMTSYAYALFIPCCGKLLT